MKNITFQTKVNLFTDIIKKYLLTNGVKYIPGQDENIFYQDEVPHRLTIKDEVVTIDNGIASKTEHYVFPVNRADILMEHYHFTSASIHETQIIHSKITESEDALTITADAVKLNGEEKKDACANKIVFFSRELLGNGLFDTLTKIRAIDNSVPVGFIQDIPKATTGSTALDDIESIEAVIKNDFKDKRTR